jgi:hypothetical protein
MRPEAEEKARKRTLLVIVLVFFFAPGLWCLLVDYFDTHPWPPHPVTSIEVEGTEYVLTCRQTIDGPLDLFLEQCEEGEPQSCIVVEEGNNFGLSCEDMRLRIRDDTIYVESPSGFRVALTYDVK